MSRFLVALVLAVGLSVQLPVVEASDWSRVVKALAASTAPIACSEHKQNTCTAFSINEHQGLYMTAFHCVGEYEEGDVASFAGKPLDLLFTNEKLDIAIFRSEVKRPAIRPRTSPVEVGMEVGSYGYGYGFPAPVFRTAVVSTFMRPSTGVEWIMLDNPLVQGMSGGPIVDRQGRLVGLNDKSDQMSGISLSINEIVRATQFWAE